MSDIYTSPFIRYNAMAVRGPYMPNPISAANMQAPAGYSGPGTGVPAPQPPAAQNPAPPSATDDGTGGGGDTTDPATKQRRTYGPYRGSKSMDMPALGVANPRISVQDPTLGFSHGTPNPRISVKDPTIMSMPTVSPNSNPRQRYAEGGLAAAQQPVMQPLNSNWRPTPEQIRTAQPVPMPSVGGGPLPPIQQPSMPSVNPAGAQHLPFYPNGQPPAPPPPMGSPPPLGGPLPPLNPGQPPQMGGNPGPMPSQARGNAWGRLRQPGQMPYQMQGFNGQGPNRDPVAGRMRGMGQNDGLGFMGGRPPLR